jgi:hypothetical protein
VDPHHRFNRLWPSGGQRAFLPLAFYAADGWTGAQVMQVAWTQWAIKVSWEVILTPATYWVVGFLKKREGVEVFDTDTSFSPFAKAAEV